MAIVEKAREKLKQDQDTQASKDETSAALNAATAAALGGGRRHDEGGDEDDAGGYAEQQTHTQSNMPAPKPKLKKKKKIKKKSAAHPPPPKAPVEPKEKVAVKKRKLINDTYTKIMKAEIQRKAEEKKAAELQKKQEEEEVSADAVENFFARRRQAAAEEEQAAGEDKSQSTETENPSHSYWSGVMGSGSGSEAALVSPSKEKTSLDNMTPQTAAAIGLLNNPKVQPRRKNKVISNSPKKSRSKNLSQHNSTDLRQTSVVEEEQEDQDEGEDEMEQEQERQERQGRREENTAGQPLHFLLDEEHLQLNSSPYEEQQQQQQQQSNRPPEEGGDDDYGDDEDFEEDPNDLKGEPTKNDQASCNSLDELSVEFKDSDTFGDAYEEELNMECERLRAELEQKMLAKFDL